MRSPFGVSPHNNDKTWFPGKKAVDCYMKYIDAGAGYVYVPAIIPGEPTAAEKELDFETLFKSQEYAGRWLGGYEGKTLIAQLYSGKRLFNYLPWAEELVFGIKQRKPDDVPIIGQAIVHDIDPEKWVEQVKKVEALGVDLIELNTGCPLGAMSTITPEKMPPEAKWGLMMGVVPELLMPIFKAVCAAAKVPVGFKLTPESGFPRMMYIVEEARNAGMQFVVTTHKYFAIAPPDIYNGGRGRYPLLGGMNPLGDVGGAMLKFSMYKATGMVSNNIPGIECFAGGGITQPENVAEAIMLGAPAAQSMTAIATDGIRFITRVNKFLERYMEEMGYERISDFKGLGLKYLCGSEDVEFEYGMAEIDRQKCTKCGKCAQSYCPAISLRDGTPEVEAEMCSCCSMCMMVCPFGAIHMVPR